MIMVLSNFFGFSVATAVSFSHNAGKYDKDEEADDEIQGRNMENLKVLISLFGNKETTVGR